jgi:hypothetical protein
MLLLEPVLFQKQIYFENKLRPPSCCCWIFKGTIILQNDDYNTKIHFLLNDTVMSLAGQTRYMLLPVPFYFSPP